MLDVFFCYIVAKPSPTVLYSAESFCGFILVLENVWGLFYVYTLEGLHVPVANFLHLRCEMGFHFQRLSLATFAVQQLSQHIDLNLQALHMPISGSESYVCSYVNCDYSFLAH